METRDIIILVVVVIYAGVRLYMRYGKEKQGTKSKSKETLGNTNTDYEPYS